MKKKIANDEIDVIGTLLTIWKNKFKVILIILFTIALALIYSLSTKQVYVATTKIDKISIFEEDLYTPFNSVIDAIKKNSQNTETKDNSIEFKLNKIDRNRLQSLFLEKIRDKNVIIDAIDKFKLIDKKKFKDKELYFKFIDKLALSLELIPPSKLENENKRLIRDYWIIRFKTLDKDKWEEILIYLNNEINNQIKKELIKKFNFQIQTIEILQNYALEDINTDIINAKKDYEIDTKKRLSFLNEQALIARELDIKNNTLEAQNFKSQSSVISNVQTKNPYYMRGYSMIEKEIALIISRSDKDDFTNNLYALENEKRNLLQNKTLSRLEKQFSNTPVLKSNNFKAANIVFNNTDFVSSISLIKLLLIAAIIGLLFGTFYVCVIDSIKQRK